MGVLGALRIWQLSFSADEGLLGPQPLQPGVDLLPSQKNGSLKTMGPYKNHMVGVGLHKNTLVHFRLFCDCER